MPAYRFILRRGPTTAVAADVPMGGELLLDTTTRMITVGDGATAGGLTLAKASVGLGNVTNDVQLKASQLETDGTLASNSDIRVPTSKAVRTYVAANAGGGSGEVTLEAALLADAPLACWLMTDASGALGDSSGNGRALTVSGALTRSYSPLADVAPVALWSGAVYASLANSFGFSTPWTGSWTVSAAVMLLAAPATAGLILFQYGVLSDETEAGNAQVFFYVTAARELNMIWEYGAGSNVVFTATGFPLELGRGYLVAARKDAAAKVFQFLVNGRVVFQAAYTQEPTGGSSGYASIGAASTAGSVSAALLGPVALYGSALSHTRLRVHARAARLG